MRAGNSMNLEHYPDLYISGQRIPDLWETRQGRALLPYAISDTPLYAEDFAEHYSGSLLPGEPYPWHLPHRPKTHDP